MRHYFENEIIQLGFVSHVYILHYLWSVGQTTCVIILTVLLRYKTNFFLVPALTCPVHFDGWSCWPETPAGSVANQSCPDFIPGFEASSEYIIVFWETDVVKLCIDTIYMWVGWLCISQMVSERKKWILYSSFEVTKVTNSQ